MSLFGISKPSDRYGVLIDIGSGSVLTAIVHSVTTESQPTVVWAHREHAPLRNSDSLEQSAKAVMTALINSSMLLDAEGRKALFDYNAAAKITEVQCTISAPWSYTVTKTVTYQQEKPFTITDHLLDEITKTVNDQMENDLTENEAVQKLGLEVVTRATMDMLTNDYHVKHPEGQKANTVTISRASVVTQQYLIKALDDVQSKLFERTSAHKLSFILALYAITREMLPQTYDICLLDITYEATEIGIMRDGVLKYSTHTPFGSFSLAREISNATNVPLHEAFGYLHTEKPYSFIKTLPEAQQKKITDVFDVYTDTISKLFNETGDELSIPKKIALHTDLESEQLFLDLVEKAAKRSIKSEPQVTLVSRELLHNKQEVMADGQTKPIPSDTALLLSANFFHTQPQISRIEFL